MSAGAPAGSPPRWTGLIGAGMRACLARRIARLNDEPRCAARAGPVQRSALRSLLQTAKDTAFGREHGFRRVLAVGADHHVLAAYRAAVPIREYADFTRWLVPMRNDAAPDLAWPGVVRDWAQTSGTTAGDKFMPVSRQLLRHNFHASLDIFAHAARFGVSLPRLFSGKCLFMGGSTDLAVSDKGVRTGDLSGLVTPLIRWPLSEVYLPGPRIALMSDWPAKIDAMAERCLDADLRAISGMASWSLVLFQRVLELARRRAAGARCLRDVWPNLELFIHGGVKYAPFDPRVREAFSASTSGPGSDIPYRVEVYPASEAFVAIQDTRHDPGLRLNVDHGVFFEFVPLEEIGRPDARAFACDEVEPGVRYVVLLSTPAGLWRYVLGDVVEFDSVPAQGRPPRLRIVGRHRHFINAFGENLIVEHIENAVARAAAACAASPGEFTAAPVYPDPSRGIRGGLELAIEWQAPSDAALRAFADAFDTALKAQNVDYTTKRTGDLGMAPPTVTPVPLGAFHRWLDSRGKLGGQHKCPRCANHREIIEQVLSISQPVEA